MKIAISPAPECVSTRVYRWKEGRQERNYDKEVIPNCAVFSQEFHISKAGAVTIINKECPHFSPKDLYFVH